MSLVPHTVFPRSLFNMDDWFKPTNSGLSTLDLFDPFDDLDRTIGRNLTWFDKPKFLDFENLMPKVPRKYRITLDCHGYSPNSIKTEVKDFQLTIIGNEESKVNEDNYSSKQFKKTYTLPSNCEPEKLVSFMGAHHTFVVEVPLKETELCLNSHLFPEITTNEDGSKSVSMKFNVPENIDPKKVHLSIKDRDLVMRAEDSVDKPDQHSKYYFYKRTTLPENTNFDEIKCSMENNHVFVTAPLTNHSMHRYRNVPIEYKSTNAIKNA